MVLIDIAKQFKLEGEIKNIEPYGNGHINTTFLIECDNNGTTTRYVLQKINTNIFTNADGLMNNIKSVTSFLREKIIANNGDPDRETLNLVPTVDGKCYLNGVDGAYRVYKFVEDTVALQIAESKEVFEGAGFAFGNFVKMLNHVGKLPHSPMLSPTSHSSPVEQIFDMCPDVHVALHCA